VTDVLGVMVAVFYRDHVSVGLVCVGARVLLRRGVLRLRCLKLDPPLTLTRLTRCIPGQG